LALQSDRGAGGRRTGPTHRDRAVLGALRGGSPVKRLAELLGVSVQAIYQAASRAEAEERLEFGERYPEILSKLAEMTDAVRFEELVAILLGQFIPALRPTQRSGDRGRDAVAGDPDPERGEELVVTASLSEDWSRKVSSDMRRLSEQGLEPRRVYAVTNRLADERRLQKLQAEAEGLGGGLTVFDARWLATQLAQPQGTGLCRDYLGLSGSGPSLFVDAADYGRLLAAGSRTAQVPFVGRDAESALLIVGLGERRTIILEAAGGLGKSRLLAEVATGDQERRWLFVREGMPSSPESLAETGTGELVVVIDDAHRRADRRALLATLERRTPVPLLVLVCRPGFREAIEGDLEGRPFGPVQELTLGPLRRADLARMLEEPPLEVRFGALRTAIVELSEGNPQIASIAAELSGRGLPLHELRGGEVMRAYAGAVIREAGEDGREKVAVMALVAAVGGFDLGGEDGDAAARLLGLPLPHLRRDVADLADRGLLIEHEGRLSVKPDVLAEHILIGCFFDRDWDPALDYADVYGAFAPGHRMEMLAVLGESFNASSDSAGRAVDRLVFLRRELSDGITAWGVGPTAEALGAIAPGLPTLALEGLDALLGHLDREGDARPGLWPLLLQVPTRVPIFEEGWRRMLTLTQRFFAAHRFEDPVYERQAVEEDGWAASLKAFDEAFSGVHQRLPIDRSPGDARMLAGVQEAMVHLTPPWWSRERGSAGAAETALLAAGTMLKVIYGTDIPDAANPMQINMMSFGVPAGESTRRSITAGFRLLSEAMPALGLKGQLRALERLRSLAHPALGFAGPFGLELSDETQAMINEIFDTEVLPWLAAELGRMPLPVAASAVELVEWRTHFGQPAQVRLEIGEDLRDYRELIEADEGWEREPLGARRDRSRVVAERHAGRLVADPEPRSRLSMWRALYEQRLAAGQDPPQGPILGILLEHVVELDPELGTETIEFLLQSDSPLLRHAAVAIAAALNHDGGRVPAWLASAPEAGRVALAWGAGELRDEVLQRRLMETLAGDGQESVREATARALRYRTALDGWQLDLALELSSDGDRVWLLADLIQEMAEGESGLSLDSGRRAAIGTAVLATADHPGDARRDDVAADLLENTQKLGVRLVWPWIWRRLDHVASGEDPRGLSDALPEQVIALAGQTIDGSQVPDVVRRLEQTTPSDWQLEAALIRLAVIGDDGTLADRLAHWVGDVNPNRRRLYRLLEAPMSWERFETYAAAVLAVDPTREMIETVVAAREPGSYFGSRVPIYEEVRDRFSEWSSSSDPNLVRLSDFGRRRLEERIAEAKLEEEQMREGFGS
jgi:hypothetical protein